MKVMTTKRFTHHASRSSSSSGVALLIAIAFLAIFSIGAGVLWSQLHARLDAAGRFEARETAHALAEAGLEKSVAALRTNPNYAGEIASPLGTGRFSTIVSRNASGYLILSRGECMRDSRVSARRELAAELSLTSNQRVRDYLVYSPEAPR